MGILEKRREKEETIFEEIIVGNFSNLRKDMSYTSKKFFKLQI